MDVAKLSTWFLSILLLSMIPTSKSDDPIFMDRSCSDTKFSSNSQYKANLNTVFGTLTSSKATSNPTGFFATSAGNDTNAAVYGLFLCYGDQNAVNCHDCVTTATSTDNPDTHCSNSMKAVIWYDNCMLRYSNESLLGKMDNDYFPMIMDGENIDGNRTRFTELVRDTMNRLAVEAANKKDRFGRKLATKVVNYTSTETVYTLVQCTPDVSNADCEQCLTSAARRLMLTKHGSQCSSPSCTAKFYTSIIDNSTPPASHNTTPSTGGKKVSTRVVTIVAPIVVVLAVVIVIIFFIRKKAGLYNAFTPKTGGDFTTTESLQLDLGTLQYMTNNFAEENKLGTGGFGAVYKGTLRNGQEVAVKRLFINSGQGLQEFKNEVLLVANLQHKNLVRLLGFCLERKEKLLVYEYIPNKSLDHFLFDPIKQRQLDWRTRYQIIVGIARGMIYLHQDSRYQVIHRDLKASNILLDVDMNPKIADFGMARIFGMDQSHKTTKRVVGTYGYMSPEYAMHGELSTKLDVYSFGVLVLEIISGKMISDFSQSTYSGDLLSGAWQTWKCKRPLEFVDQTIRDSCIVNEVMRCIQVGLLCVQHSKDDRPTMVEVLQMLDDYSTFLSTPDQPAFFMQTTVSSHSKEDASNQSSHNLISFSMNDDSFTGIEPR